MRLSYNAVGLTAASMMAVVYAAYEAAGMPGQKHGSVGTATARDIKGWWKRHGKLAYGHLPLTLTPEQAEKPLRDLAKKALPTAMNGRAYLRRLWNWAVTGHRIGGLLNPFASVSLPSPTIRTISSEEALDKDDVTAFLAACEAP